MARKTAVRRQLRRRTRRPLLMPHRVEDPRSAHNSAAVPHGGSTSCLHRAVWWRTLLLTPFALFLYVPVAIVPVPDPHGAGGRALQLHSVEAHRASLVSASTAITTPLTTATVVPPTPRATAPTTGTIFSNNFDSQAPGQLATGESAMQFKATTNPSRLSVQTAVAASPPNALAVSISGGGNAYASEQYTNGFTTHDLTFHMQLGNDFALGSSGDYLVLAQTMACTSTNAGKVNIVLSGDGKIRLDYFDSVGVQHSLYGTGYVLPLGSWHTVELRETVGVGTGSLALLVDGAAVVNGGTTLDTGVQGINRFLVGAVFATTDAATSGELYIDDVVATTTEPLPTPTPSIFSNGFDGQGAGGLVTGSGANQFTGVNGASRLSVETTIAASPPNALAVATGGGGSAYAYKQYSRGYIGHDLTFGLQLANDLTLPITRYLMLAQTVPYTSSNAGKVNIVLPGDGKIRLDYFDSVGVQHSLYGTGYVLPLGSWHTVELRETVGVGTGSLTLKVDGSTVVSGTDLDTGNEAITYFKIGDTYAPTDTSIAGHVYIDDVSTLDLGAAPSPTPTATGTPSSGGAIKTVFLIVMENHNWSSIQGNTSEAPYINNTLLPQSSYAQNYNNPPGNHPSLPNYLWLEAGQCYSYCGTDDDPRSSPYGITTTQHLTTLLTHAGISWTAYEEGIGDGACPLSNTYLYAARHNPFVYFNDVSGNPAYCTAHEKSFTDLASALATNAVAHYNFITPNLCDDMHDSCSPLNDAIKQGDTWLSQQVPQILNSAAYKNGGALFITWDEGENGSDGPIGMIVLSPEAKGHGYANSLSYTHSSTLRTLEEIFGVSPWLGGAANATDLRDLFTTFP